MKTIVAFVKPHKADSVVEAVKQHNGFTGVSMSDVRGCGRGKGALDRHTRVELTCRDEDAEEIVDAIQQQAHTGLKGDGKIYVIPTEEAVRISTNARGDDAV